jgi:hypothetical protein
MASKPTERLREVRRRHYASKSLDLKKISVHTRSRSATTSSPETNNDTILATAYCHQCSNQVWSGLNRWEHAFEAYYTPGFSTENSSGSYRISGLKAGGQQRKISASASSALAGWYVSELFILFYSPPNLQLSMHQD